MSETIGAGTAAGSLPNGTETVHEAYSFACMRCGYAWEQAYEIKHQIDAQGRMSVRYLAEGKPVPSPLTRPSCASCGGSIVRIMQAGRVPAAVLRMAPKPRSKAQPKPQRTRSRARNRHWPHLFHRGDAPRA